MGSQSTGTVTSVSSVKPTETLDQGSAAATLRKNPTGSTSTLDQPKPLDKTQVREELAHETRTILETSSGPKPENVTSPTSRTTMQMLTQTPTTPETIVPSHHQLIQIDDDDVEDISSRAVNMIQSHSEPEVIVPSHHVLVVNPIPPPPTDMHPDSIKTEINKVLKDFTPRADGAEATPLSGPNTGKLTIKEALFDPNISTLMKAHCASEFSTENFDFIKTVQGSLKNLANSGKSEAEVFAQLKREICEPFCRTTSPRQINVDAVLRDVLVAAFDKNPPDLKGLLATLKTSTNEISTLIENDTLLRFKTKLTDTGSEIKAKIDNLQGPALKVAELHKIINSPDAKEPAISVAKSMRAQLMPAANIEINNKVDAAISNVMRTVPPGRAQIAALQKIIDSPMEISGVPRNAIISKAEAMKTEKLDALVAKIPLDNNAALTTFVNNFKNATSNKLGTSFNSDMRKVNSALDELQAVCRKYPGNDISSMAKKVEALAKVQVAANNFKVNEDDNVLKSKSSKYEQVNALLESTSKMLDKHNSKFESFIFTPDLKPSSPLHIKINQAQAKFNDNQSKFDEIQIKKSTGARLTPEELKLEKDFVTAQVLSIRTIQALINSKPNWGDDATAIDKLEASINTQKDKIIASSKTSDPFKAKGEINLTPTTWVGNETLPNRNPNDPLPDLANITSGSDDKKGAQGCTFTFKANGRALLGKSDRSNAEGNTRQEFDNYQAIYSSVGRHPNLANVHGWADMRIGQMHTKGMLMDQIPGKNGMETQVALSKALSDGVITEEQYMGAMQYMATKLIDATQHLASAGFVHNDIKPENYMINSQTGDLILIDLGGASKANSHALAATKQYAPPEFFVNENGDKSLNIQIEHSKPTQKSDVYCIGASIFHAVKGPTQNHEKFKPNEKIKEFNPEASNVPPGKTLAYARAAFNNFIKSTTADKAVDRSDLSSARQLPFLDSNNRLLDDNQAKALLKGITDGSLRTTWEDGWKAKRETAISEGRQIEIPQAVDKALNKEIINTIKNDLKPKTKSLPTEDQPYTAIGVLRDSIGKANKIVERADKFGINTKILKDEIKLTQKAIEKSITQLINGLSDKIAAIDLSGIGPKFPEKIDTARKEIRVARETIEFLKSETKDPKKLEVINKELAKLDKKNEILLTQVRGFVTDSIRDLGKLDVNTARTGFLKSNVASLNNLIAAADDLGIDVTALQKLVKDKVEKEIARR
jgi:serine/threonine protein kinase